MNSYVIRNATIINEGRKFKGSVLISDRRIERVLSSDEPCPDARVTVDASGKYLLPGVIDDQVHFREPGLTHKADIYTEAKAAAAGGVTSFMDMPNTVPQTVTLQLLEEKFQIAGKTSLVNFSFYLGATNDNIREIRQVDPGTVCGIKVFLGSSTGNMLVNDPDTLHDIFSQSPILVAIHSEDEETIQKNEVEARKQYGEDVPVHLHAVIRSEEACYRSTSRAVELAERHHTRLHILHLSTARELTLLRADLPLAQKRITAEACVHHLMFSDKDYPVYGNRIKWNPSVKTENDRQALLEGLQNNRIDVVATDHAPHTLEEKSRTYFKAPSGGPLVQHSLPAMMELCYEGRITPEILVQKMCHAPAILFGIHERGFIREGYMADLVILDPDSAWTVDAGNILYKCGWSPFEGKTFRSAVTHTFVNGNLVYENGTFHEGIKGERLTFDRNRTP